MNQYQAEQKFERQAQLNQGQIQIPQQQQQSAQQNVCSNSSKSNSKIRIIEQCQNNNYGFQGGQLQNNSQSNEYNQAYQKQNLKNQENNIIPQQLSFDGNLEERTLISTLNQGFQQKNDLLLTQNEYVDINETLALTKINNCLYCGSGSSSDKIMLPCYHEYHNQCLKEQINIYLSQQSFKFYCKCNTQITYKCLIRIMENDQKMVNELCLNQLAWLIHQTPLQTRRSISGNPNDIKNIKEFIRQSQKEYIQSQNNK